MTQGFFSDNIKNIAKFRNATAKEIGLIDVHQMRAVLLLHEAKHHYTLIGHEADPATYDDTWNDYILWTGFLGQKVAGV